MGILKKKLSVWGPGKFETFSGWWESVFLRPRGQTPVPQENPTEKSHRSSSVAVLNSQEGKEPTYVKTRSWGLFIESESRKKILRKRKSSLNM